MNITEWTYDWVSIKILNEEMRHGEPDSVGEPEMVSYMRSGGAKSKKRGPVTCYRCRKMGHIHRDCPDRKKLAGVAAVEDTFAS